MPWVRFDDQYPIHRKVAGLTDGAFRLDVEALCWSARNRTDGRIAVDDLPNVDRKARTGRQVAELVRRGRWHEAGYECPSEHCPPSGPDGWVIHDFLEYQPSSDKVAREKAAKAERQRRWIEARKNGRDASKQASHDASKDAAPGDAAPAPTRPAPKEGGGGAPAATAARRAAAGAGGGGRKDQNHAAVRPANCRLHQGQPAHNCALCRADRLAAKGQP
jgi:hypothetical protein